MNIFFVEDVVALKADPTITGIVSSTWRELDAANVVVPPDDWVTHADVPEIIRAECLARGKPPENYVLVEFLQPYSGTTVVAEQDLTLLDRALRVGDIVKRDYTNAESGTVTKTYTKCRIQPIYTDLPYQGSEPWPHKPEDNELWVTAEELYPWDYRPGDYVAFKGWIGEVVTVREEVTVRLGDGSAVRVRNPEELDAPYWTGDFRRSNRRLIEGRSLVENLRIIRQLIEETTDRKAMLEPHIMFAGRRIHTKKSNLRLGNWVIGQYSASQPPTGVIVETRVIELDVDWVATNMFDPRQSKTPPDNILSTNDLDQVRLCNTQLPDSEYGSRVAREMMSGDYCRFRNEPGAAVRYGEGSSGGHFRRIPRTQTQGFNMNVFRIVETRTDVDIQWQDSRRTHEDSKAVIPYLNVDEHDLWPGDIVCIKSMQQPVEGMVKAAKLGVVQTVDSIDRVAHVRWWTSPDVAHFEQDESTLVAGAECGELSTESSAVTLYDLTTYPALGKRRGDIVAISPDLRRGINRTMEQMNSKDTNAFFGVVQRVRDAFSSDPTMQTETADGMPWVGEVVDLGLDGMLTVRLGAMKKPEDVRVPVDKLLLLLSTDTESLLSDEAEDEVMEDIESAAGSQDTIEEIISYEGGMRLDDGEEDAWMTDEDNSEEGEAERNTIKAMDGSAGSVAFLTEDSLETNGTIRNSHLHNSDGSPSAPSRPAFDHPEYQFNEYSNMPPQFAVLDEPPPADHHFLPHNHSWSNPSMLRRIRKEHNILQSSLPRGIWVRTWADRLDLFRILIIGPRGTPYALAPFVLDFAFGNGYPNSPPEAFFHSWTGQVGRINPNLYEDGKVCLSILGTWPGSEKTEAWSADHSSMLQVLVSLLGLVLVERPYYNEAGFENLVGSEESVVNERVYSEKALVMAKNFVVHALSSTIVGLDDILKWIYTDVNGPNLLRWVVDEARKLRTQDGRRGEPTLSKGALILLERYLPILEGLLEKA